MNPTVDGVRCAGWLAKAKDVFMSYHMDNYSRHEMVDQPLLSVADILSWCAWFALLSYYLLFCAFAMVRR